MDDLPWKIFSKTGNIESYLLMKGHDYELSDEIPQDNKLTGESLIDQLDWID